MIRSTLFAVALIASSPALAQTKTSASGAVESISRAKVLANAEAEFARVDTNKDGQMSRTEIEEFQRAAATRIVTARNQAVFAALDADKNGQISASEFAKLNNTPIKVDPSGVLSVDTNKDGQLSLAEHRAATLSTFAQFDTNKDGALTAAEAQGAKPK